MRKSVKNQRLPTGVKGGSRRVADASTKEVALQLPTKEQISALMSMLGSKGGKIGGKRRLQTMTPERRREVARKAALTRWKRETK